MKPGILKKEEEEELRSIMKIASEQKQHMIPMDWEDTDCPEIWSDGKQTVTYDWYEEAGPVLSAATERFNAPLAGAVTEESIEIGIKNPLYQFTIRTVDF